MRHRAWVGVFLCSLVLAGSEASSAVITYTSSADFLAALSAPLLENYESLPVNSLIPDGGFLNGLQYFFPAGTSGRIDDLYNRVGVSSLALDRPLGGANFFIPGEALTVVFPSAIDAVGIFFNVALSPVGSLSVSTPAGSAVNGVAYDISSLYFVGLISDTPFSTATFSGNALITSGFNLDELTWQVASTASVPEPGSAALMALGALLGVAAARARRRD